MQKIRNIIGTIVGIILTVIVIGIIYLFADSQLGTWIMQFGVACLFVIFTAAVIGLIKGSSNFLRIKTRFNLSLVLTYSVAAGICLLFIWAVNAVLEEEYGRLTVTEKMAFVHQPSVAAEEMALEFTKDYPEEEYRHITFRYHPDTKPQVQKMIDTLESLANLEKEIYGYEIDKTEPLEVVVLGSSEDYIQLNSTFNETNVGYYNTFSKKAVVYHDTQTAEDSFVLGIFAHEYNHYLFDLFAQKENIDESEIPPWFEEGISEYVRSQITDTVQYPEESNTTTSYSDLRTQQEWLAAAENSDVYHLAYEAIDYLSASKDGPKILSEILIDQKATGNFNESFSKITGLEVNQLKQAISQSEEDLKNTLDQAFNTWNQEGDYAEADELYRKLLENHPKESLAWHQYALMLEEEQKWEDALTARQKMVSLTPDEANSYLQLSKLLILSDAEEAVEMANKALSLTKKNPYGNVTFVEQWVKAVTQYRDLLQQGEDAEAYRVILQTEQVTYSESLAAEIRNRAER
ncbi:collagenase [Marinilactibacillus piezotolerans]|uniref:collagenase n=1 Tax=Marinilactibacillus piezotolerans TaxID=258723 RepID=UPI0009B0D9CE|nr:collagenase [Marinilactibacillus piezotolerans]